MYRWLKLFREGRTIIEDVPWTAHFDKSREKVIIEVIYDYKGIIYEEFIPVGQTVNEELYQENHQEL